MKLLEMVYLSTWLKPLGVLIALICFTLLITIRQINRDPGLKSNVTSLFEALDDLLTWFILWKHSGKVMVLLVLLCWAVIDRYQWHQRVMSCIEFYHEIYDYHQCENYLRVLSR